MIENQGGFPVSDVDSLSGLIKTISDLTKTWPRRWFRGVGGDYNLEPGVFREYNELEEDYIVKSFRRMAGIFVPNLNQSDDVSVVCMAQHYGLPTRLLDWSESLTVALFFAFDSWKKKGKDGEDLFVWCINPVILNLISEKKWSEMKEKTAQIEFQSCVNDQSNRGVYVADSSRVKHMAKFSFSDSNDVDDRDSEGNPDNMPVAFFPHFFDKRISLQRSCFTIQGRNDLPLDMQLLQIITEKMKKNKEQLSDVLICVRIRKQNVLILEKEFQVISPTPTTIFGDVEGLVKEILESTQSIDETDSDD